MEASILIICYIISAVTFILGLKMLSDPATAKRGNRIAGAGMVLAIFATIFLYSDESGNHLRHYVWIGAALLIGSIIGAAAAKKVKMTAMPEMVSLFNGMGGACAALISINEFMRLNSYFHSDEFSQTLMANDFFTMELVIIFAGLIIGSISFAGSIIAWGKLNGRIKDIAFRGQHIVNLVLFAGILALTLYLITFQMRQVTLTDIATPIFLLVFLLCVLYGVMFVLPIGGADMPVVISLLNSFTGVAAACGGFLYDNKAMLTGGILVGAAGTLLTILMCKAMNRSLKNVLIGSFGAKPTVAGAPGQEGEAGVYKEIPVGEAALLMTYANKVMIVPGYGLAVAQAQHACHELEKLLTVKGVDVKYAIHPVAGRMPGHMNVLLAEADVSYDKLLEMEQANEEFPTTDIVLVLGANDVVNPAAKTDPSSPIYGMPILEVELAKSVIVNKRSMKPGYAGIENQLFFRPKTSMLFGDAKDVLQHLVMIIKNL